MSTTLTKSAGQASVGIFGMIGAFATQATRTMETAGKALDMVDNFVGKQHVKQVAQDEVELADYWQTLLEESKANAAERQLKLVDRLKDNDFKELYNGNDKLFRLAIQKAGERLGREVHLDD